jgi:hypothetical protein
MAGSTGGLAVGPEAERLGAEEALDERGELGLHIRRVHRPVLVDARQREREVEAVMVGAGGSMRG